MKIELSKVWAEVEKLLEDGISLIPVRDKDEVTKQGDTLLAKTPYGKWTEFQRRLISKEELWQQMEGNNTNAVAIICGAISGNMEVIDVDVKYKPGIDAILMNDIRSFYPDLFSRLRIHKTPSSGYHIIYRIDGGEAPGNFKLAGRMANEDEIELQIKRGVKRPNKEINFLETRGEKGYILAPPSLGYSLHKDNPIPTITWEERCSLITLCQSYNEIVREAPKPKPSKSQTDFYDENPFEHFNRSADPVELLERFGWKFSHKNAHFIWFTRPDKTRGVSASWNLNKHIFYIFTSSTELQSERGYHASTILAELEFAGDKSKTYYYLVQNGYGKVKPSVEATIVKRSALSGKGIPANFSTGAQAQYTITQEQLKEDHPFGIFWEQDEDGKVSISREGLYKVSNDLGYRLYKEAIVQIRDIFIYDVSERDWMDALEEYIREEDPGLYEDIFNSYESFMQRSAAFTIKRLRVLDTQNIVHDTREVCYKYFLNGYITITASEITFNKYEELSGLVFYSKVQPRDFRAVTGGRYVEFLNKALVKPEHNKRVLGYLSHEYKDETTGYIILLIEACPDPKLGGGSGKNVFCNLLRLTTTYSSSPGSQSKFDEKFFQSWNGERIFGINDLPKNFDFANFKEAATGTIKLKKLYKDEENIEVENTPKLIMQTNFSYVKKDGGVARRVVALEFSDFFTRCGGLDVHFGVHFPKGWSDDDYSGFDNYIAEAIQSWIQGGLKLTEAPLTEGGWIKQFIQTYGKTAASFVIEKFSEIVAGSEITNDEFANLITDYYAEHKISKFYETEYIKFSEALKVYCEHHGVDVKTDQKIRVGQYDRKNGRKFTALNEDGAKLLSEIPLDEEAPF